MVNRVFLTVLLALVLASTASAIWWNNDFDSRVGLSFSVVGQDLNKTSMVNLRNVDLTTFTILCEDLNDFRLVYDATNTETDFNVMDWNGGKTDGDVNILFQSPVPLPAGDYNSAFYFYSDNAACPVQSRFGAQGSFDDFEDGNYTSDPLWFPHNKGIETFEVQSVIVKNGSESFRMTANSTAGKLFYDGNVPLTTVSGYIRANNLANGGEFKLGLPAFTGGESALEVGNISLWGNNFQVWGDGGWTDTGIGYDINTWYWVKADIDNANNSFDAYFYSGDRAVVLASVIGQVFKNAGTIEVFGFGAINNANAIDIYFDDVVYTTTFPTSPAFGAPAGKVISTSFSTSLVVSGDNNSTHSVVSFEDTTTYDGTTVTDKGYRWDFNEVFHSFDQNTTKLLELNADHNICYDTNATVDAVPDSDQNCSILSFAAGNLVLNFFDENTGAAVNPSTLTVNGVDATSFLVGNVLTYPVTITDTYVISVGASGYTTRNFNYDANVSTTLNVNALLLKETDGRSIDFLWLWTDETTVVSNTYIEVRLEDTNIVTRKKTDSLGQITLFLRPETDYNFHVLYNDIDKIFNVAVLTVKLPKDEITKATVTDWNIAVSRLENIIDTNLIGDFNFNIFPNTVKYYNITVDSTGYFQRKYDIKTLGDTTSAVLQPYLVAESEGVSTKIVTRSPIDYDPIANVEVRIYKYQQGAGRELIETVITDGKGEAFISGQTNQSYEFEVYFEGELIDSPDITVTSTTIIIQFVILTEPDVEIVPTANVGFVPAYNSIVPSQSNLSQRIGISNGTIIDINIWILHNDTNIYTQNLNVDNNAISNGYTNFVTVSSLVTAGWNDRNSILVHVAVRKSDGNISLYIHSYHLQDLNFAPDVIPNLLRRGIKEDFGCAAEDDSCGGLIILSIFLTMIGIGALIVSTPLGDPKSIGLVAVSFLALFTWLTWFPLFYFIILTAFVVIGVFATGRGL